MTDYDVVQIIKLLERADAELENRIIDMKNKYSIFKDFDCLDLLELQELKFNLDYHRQFEQKLLELVYFLQQNNRGQLFLFDSDSLPLYFILLVLIAWFFSFCYLLIDEFHIIDFINTFDFNFFKFELF